MYEATIEEGNLLLRDLDFVPDPASVDTGLNCWMLDQKPRAHAETLRTAAEQMLARNGWTITRSWDDNGVALVAHPDGGDAQ